MKVEPIYEDKIVYEYVISEELLKEDEIISIEAKKNYKESSRSEDDSEDFSLPPLV